MDAALTWKDYGADIRVQANDLVSDAGLPAAVIVSLFTDRRAPDDAALPYGDTDRRGHWTDTATASVGSLLWLLSREKTLPETAERAREYCETALQWLIEDGIAVDVDVTTALVRPYGLQIRIAIYRGASREYAYLWEDLAQKETVVWRDTSIDLIFVD
ncbi:phage GP46 family protein [Nostoc linckia]|uniref:phage GP46 family protein n=1 Tax=Nostoc linckia TaxID=92942 RepID=UPI000BFFD75A|nr:phage GP46 family protein [Nostoc linckia]